jgi:hypothetical protein
MHLHPNGDDLTGKGGSGYMMVLNMLLKPSFMIFGFIASIVLSSVFGEFINKIYFQVFSFSQGDGNGIMGFMKTVFGISIYVGLMFMFIKKCFSLMGFFSDEIFKWIGGHSANLGGHAEHMQSGTNNAVAQAASFLGTKAVSERMQSAGKAMSDNIRDSAKKKMELAEKEKNNKSQKDKSKPIDDNKKSYSDLTREKRQAQDSQGNSGMGTSSTPNNAERTIADSKPNMPSESQANQSMTGAADDNPNPEQMTITDVGASRANDFVGQVAEAAAGNVSETATAAASSDIQPGQAQEQSIPDTTAAHVQVRTSEVVIPPADQASPVNGFDQSHPNQAPNATDNQIRDES